MYNTKMKAKNCDDYMAMAALSLAYKTSHIDKKEYNVYFKGYRYYVIDSNYIKLASEGKSLADYDKQSFLQFLEENSINSFSVEEVQEQLLLKF